MVNLTDLAVMAAAQAILAECFAMASCPPGLKAGEWLRSADDYQRVARAALVAALPYLEESD